MAYANQGFDRAMTLAALSGLKIALGPAFLETARRRPSGRGWVLGAMGEMLLDKVGIFPPRYRPSLLIPHALAGAWVARESMREDGQDDTWAAPMGAVVAAGVASIAPILRIASRKILGVPDPLLGVLEDYLALKLGTQAVNMPMEQLTEVAKEAVGELEERVKPALQSIGVEM